jgi:hypothetical protein
VIDAALLRRHRDPWADLVLFREFLKRRLADIDHHLDNIAGEWERRQVNWAGRSALSAAENVEIEFPRS